MMTLDRLPDRSYVVQAAPETGGLINFIKKTLSLLTSGDEFRHVDTWGDATVIVDSTITTTTYKTAVTGCGA